jgi:hypothetical protein
MERDIIVSTGDISQKYEIIGPVYFQINNRPEGFESSTFSDYKEIYVNEINQLKDNVVGREKIIGSKEWGCAWGKWCLGQSNFEIAFFIAVEELKKRAAMLGADGIIFMRQDIDLDREAYQFFYLQMYGTAVKMM